MPIWLITHWRLIMALGIAATIVGGYFYLERSIRKDERAACVAEHEAALIAKNEQIKTVKRTVKHETQSLDRDAIVAELCKRQWVRGGTGCLN